MSERATCRLFVLVLLVFGIAGLPAFAQRQAPERALPETSAPEDEQTKVFVLGTPHLSSVEDRFQPSMVDSLIAVLGQFRPDAIAVEKISGRQTAAMEQWGGRWDKVAQHFAGAFLYHGHQVHAKTGWTWSEAHRRADSLLTVARSDSQSLAPTARLNLVASLVAAYRIPTATLQWRYLAPDVRSNQSALPDTTAAALDNALDSANEVYSIGMRLAQDLDHQRLYPIDHQAEKDLAIPIFQPLMQAIGDSMRAALENDPVLRRADSLETVGLKSGDLLPMYRYLNRETVGRADARIQWGTMLDANLPGDIGRKWLALWESRNLHMVGHIRRVTSKHPGGRVLVIVGSSHKPFFDAYLRQMMGVEVMDAEDVLAGS